MQSDPAVSIVIPAYNESDSIRSSLTRIAKNVTIPFEVIVVVDSAEDSTIPVIDRIRAENPNVRCEIQESRGPAGAIKFGFSKAIAPVVIVTMADGSDDPASIDTLVQLVDRGCVIAAASRYMPGGQQIGGPRFKAFLSRSAGKSLKLFAGVTTSDATNSYKAYSRAFVEEVGIQSDAGFEIAIELVAKARRLRRPIAEVPTIWLDRDAGESRFMLKKWIPKYLKWYRFAFGPELTVQQLTSKREEGKL
jgi:glycosyltransferase involved in cell wall biosynthesis